MHETVVQKASLRVNMWTVPNCCKDNLKCAFPVHSLLLASSRTLPHCFLCSWWVLTDTSASTFLFILPIHLVRARRSPLYLMRLVLVHVYIWPLLPWTFTKHTHTANIVNVPLNCRTQHYPNRCPSSFRVSCTSLPVFWRRVVFMFPGVKSRGARKTDIYTFELSLVTSTCWPNQFYFDL